MMLSYLGLILNCLFISIVAVPDCTIVSQLLIAGDGMGQIPVLWADALHDKVELNFKITNSLGVDLKDLSKNALTIYNKGFKEYGNIILVNSCYWITPNQIKNFPAQSIKLLYGLTESTGVPVEWVDLINNNFDGLVAGDAFVAEVYKKNGVTKPIFVLPLPAALEDFLTYEKTTINKQFTFGTSGVFVKRKNHLLLLDAFINAFGLNNPNVKLKLHGRYSVTDTPYYEQLQKRINDLQIVNVELINNPLSRKDYVNWMNSLDCYVYLSAGEGFSLTPREAMAARVPVILSNNTAHGTICKTGHVISVNSNEAFPAYYDLFKRYIGEQFDCRIQDVQKALKQAYLKKDLYRKKAIDGRAWVTFYLPKNIGVLYKNLIKPLRIELGNENVITEYGILTNCSQLLEKYQKINNI